MAKRFFAFISLIIIALFFSACAPGTAGATGFYEPYSILEADMPYADSIYTARFDTVKELECDHYGRRYFSYTTFSSSIYQEIEIHVICQQTKSGNAYYYPDYCYIFRLSESDPFSNQEIALLKERNDWNFPLDEGKMCNYPKNPNSHKKPLIYEFNLEPIVLNYLNLSEKDYSAISNDLEFVGDFQQLFFVTVFKKGALASNVDSKRYLLVYDSSNQFQPIAAIEEIELSFDCQDAMHDFRTTWFSQ